MAWNDLTLSDKARMIKLAVKSGITDLRSIKEVYNKYAEGGRKFGPGGDKSANVIQLLRAFASTDKGKKLAYKIGAYNHEGAGITPLGIVAALSSKYPFEYDELKEYLFPGSAEYTPYTGESKGPLTQDKYKGIRQFISDSSSYSQINPREEYIFPEEYKGLLEELARRRGTIYSNSDIESDSSERYDAANYPIRFRYDASGDIVADAADLYDFDPEYAKRYGKNIGLLKKALVNAESDLLSRAGTPYIMRQENIPVTFSKEGDDGVYAAKNMVDAIAHGETGSQYREDDAIVNILSRLGNGTITPSVVTEEDIRRATQENYFAKGGKKRRKKVQYTNF